MRRNFFLVLVFCFHRVCKQWNKDIKTSSLWEVIDLIQPGVHLNKKTWAYMRRYFTSSLTTLHIGFSSSEEHLKTITSEAIQAISNRCGSLKDLTLTRLDVSKLKSDMLPTSLVALQIIECKMKDCWLGQAAIANNLDGLERLKIRWDGDGPYHCMNEMITFPKLQKLSLSRPQRYPDDGTIDPILGLVVMPTSIATLQEYCPELDTLEMANCFMWGKCLMMIGSRLRDSLKHLYLKNCLVNGDAEDWYYLKNILHLETLHIIKCFKRNEDLEKNLIKEFEGKCEFQLVPCDEQAEFPLYCA